MNTNEMIAILRISDDPQKLAAADELQALLDEEGALQARVEQMTAEVTRLDQALADTAAQLTQAVERVAELEAELREARKVLKDLTYYADLDSVLRPGEGFYCVTIQDYIELQDANGRALKVLGD